MRLEEYLNENMELSENIFIAALKKLKSKTEKTAFKVFKGAWDKIAKMIRPDQEDRALTIINKQFGTRYKSLTQIGKDTIKESTDINEDWKHYWEMLKFEGFPTLAFFPALTSWIELGKLFEPDQAVNWTKFSVYALFWLMLVSGKFVGEFRKWKKENPEEFAAERPHLLKKKIEKEKKGKVAKAVKSRGTYGSREESPFVKALGKKALKKKQK